MSNSRQTGMTLIELIVAIVIISIGLAGMLLAFNTTVRHSGDPLARKQMSAIAEEMMEEILLKPFAKTLPGPPFAGCARLTHNDVRDYDGYNVANVCDIEGNGITALSGYEVSVSVSSPPTASAVSLSGVPDNDQLTVKVIVKHASDEYSLTGWRTCYAGPVWPCPTL